MPTQRAIGIDLGTTRSAAAELDAAGRSRMLRNALGDVFTPSVVYFEDDEIVIGRPAKQAATLEPARAAEYAKRDLGQPTYSRAIGGELLPAEVIEACLLGALIAEDAAGGEGRPAVALAHPASFGRVERQALLDAAELAGLDVLGTIHDPLAIALAFAETQGYLEPGAQKPAARAMVFDLGGGKLDVVIVEIKTTGLRTRATGGDARLGGRDWDALLADHLAGEFAKQFGQDPRHDVASVRRLLDIAEEAKHTLSVRQQARVRVDRGGHVADVAVTRQAFERMTAELVERARIATEEVLSRASMAWRDLTHLLLVGGAARMPMIGQMLETLTFMKGAPQIHPDESVARGTALYAEHLLARRERRQPRVAISITDLSRRSLGLEWLDPATAQVENVVLIPRGSDLPSVTTSKVTTPADGQSTISLNLLEGESRDAAACQRVGQLVLHSLPSDLPRYAAIDVEYRVTAEGDIEVQAHMQLSGDTVGAEVRPARVLCDEARASWARLLTGPAGLSAIRRELARFRTSNASQPIAVAAEPEQAEPAPTGPPPIPASRPAAQEVPFEIESHYITAAAARRKAKNSQRKVLINVVGYLVFSALGLAIGYYIVMIFRPEWNIYRLQLPGLSVPAPRGDAALPGTD